MKSLRSSRRWLPRILEVGLWLVLALVCLGPGLAANITWQGDPLTLRNLETRWSWVEESHNLRIRGTVHQGAQNLVFELANDHWIEVKTQGKTNEP